MAKNESKAVTKEYAQQFSQELAAKLVGRPKGLARDIKTYADNKLQDPRKTHMFIANDKMSLTLYYKMIAFNSIISSAKYGLGTDYNFDEVKEVLEKAKEIEEAMDSFIKYAYEKGIGNKKHIERYRKMQEEQDKEETAKAEA